MTVTIKKIGGSLAVFIPRSMARETKLTEGTTMDISTGENSIVIRKKSGRRAGLSRQIVSQIKPGSYRRRRAELSQDQPLGKEIW